jgi:hypothetical protein
MTVTGNNENKLDEKVLRRWRMALEAGVLFLFAWLTTVAVNLMRPSPTAGSTHPDILNFLQSTIGTGFELFIFGYLLSRFFKQFKTGCAFVIILFFAYLVWAGRHHG